VPRLGGSAKQEFLEQRDVRRLEPMQKRLFGGCHLTRQIDDLVEAAGFTI